MYDLVTHICILNKVHFLNSEMITSEKGKNSKLPLGKGGSGLGSRKALGDITNKPNITKEASTRKKSSPKEEFNILEERFLHDHKKCIESQQAMSELMFLDIVLPGHGNFQAPVSFIIFMQLRRLLYILNLFILNLSFLVV